MHFAGIITVFLPLNQWDRMYWPVPSAALLAFFLFQKSVDEWVHLRHHKKVLVTKKVTTSKGQ